MLVGRGSERAEIDELLADARAGRGRVLVLRGEPGIGKTALLGYAAERAEGMLVLRALGVESESELPFSALHELLRPLLRGLDALPVMQADALRTAFALAPAQELDRFAVFVAAHTLLTDAAARRPLLCLVDDAQWIDGASADSLRFASRRFGADAIAVLFSAREGDPRAFEAPEIAELPLAGLHRDAAEALLDRVSPGLAPEVRERILNESSGNPLALVEMPVAVRVGTGDPMHGPLPIGPRLTRAFLRRVASLSEAAQCALLVAAASDVSDMRVVADALGRLRRTVRDLEEAERALLITLAGGTVLFTHPLIRSAAYAHADPAARRDAHRAIAAALGRVGAAERAAWHLAAAATGPDETAAAALEGAAVSARKRGALAAEARAFERAASLTPAAESRARRLIAAARAARTAGNASAAERLVSEALERSPDEGTWADTQVLLADISYWRGDNDRVVALAEGAERLAATDRGQAASLLMLASMARGPSGPEEAVALADRALLLEPAHPQVAVVKANMLFRLGRGAEALAVLAPLVGPARRARSADVLFEVGVTLAVLEQYEEALRLAHEAIAQLRERGALKELAHALAGLTHIETRRGDLAAAYEAGLAAFSLSESLGEPLQVAFAASFLAACESAMGLEDETRRHAAVAIAAAPGEGRRTTLEARSAIGSLELQLGRVDEAIDQLERVVAALRSLGVREPGYVQSMPELIEAYVRAGRTALAEQLLDELERQSNAAGRSWALAAAGRCRGLLAPDAELDRAFDAALARHAGDGRPLERARTELAYGERLRRAGRRVDARPPLRAALATFETAGARLLADRTRSELAATGERLARRQASAEELTPQELQVALVVSRGTTNREAAAELFLSPKTIEFHLRNSYRKLGVRSRTELANVLRGGQLGATR